VFLKTFKTIRHKQPHLFLHYMKPNPHSVSAILWHKTHQLFSVLGGGGGLWEGTEVISYSIKVFHKLHGLQSVHMCTFPMAFQTGTQSLPNFLMKIIKIE
jgi:hypothetical protein